MGIVAGLVLFGVLVVVHEFGHFLFAKALGVKVLTFSVGFGPRLFSFKRGDTEYQVCLIPLGGYVRMFGQAYEEEVSDADKARSFLHQRTWRKTLIALAGPVFNFILPIFLFFALLVGNETILDPVVGTLIPGEPAAMAGLKPGDRILAVEGAPVDRFDAMVEKVAARPGISTQFTIERKDLISGQSHRLELRITPRAEKNPNPVENDKTVGRIGMMPVVEKPLVTVVSASSEAAKAGLRNFDEIVSVNGKALSTLAEVFTLLKAFSDKSIRLEVKRAANMKEINGTLSADFPAASPDDDEIDEIPLQPKTDAGETAIHVIELPPTVHDNSGNMPSPTVEPHVKRFAVNADELASSAMTASMDATRSALLNASRHIESVRGIASTEAVLADVKMNSPAAYMGLEAGSRILAIDGKEAHSWLQVYKAFEGDKEGIHVAGIAHTNNTLSLVVFRLAKNTGDGLGGPRAAWFLGEVVKSPYMPGASHTEYVGPVDAVVRAIVKTQELLVMNIKSLVMLFKREVPMSQLGGPIMIFGLAGEAAHQGVAFYLNIMALLSINLGLLNLLPIPVLDGGHILLFAIEAVIRRPLSTKARTIANQIGLVIVLLLMVVALFNDIVRLAN
jgi:regulator of sigma E protease